MSDELLIKDSILGFVIGDALGVPIEFKSRDELSKNPLKDMIGYGSHKVPAGTWSDDSSMMLATMDSIIEKGKIDYDDMMKKFFEWYMNSKYTATGITFDIGIATQKALIKFYNDVPTLECGGKNEYDNGNGSLMRILPIVLYLYANDYREEQEIEILNNCSSLTHAHEISKLGCKIYCDFVKSLIGGYSKKDALEKITTKDYHKNYSDESISKYKNILSGEISKFDVNRIKSSGFIVHTLEACIWCVLNTSSYEEAVLKAVNLGEDTDTIGAITGSMAGIIYGSEQIPSNWLDKLKNKEYLNNIIEKYNNVLKLKNNKKEEKIK